MVRRASDRLEDLIQMLASTARPHTRNLPLADFCGEQRDKPAPSEPVVPRDLIVIPRS